MDADSVRERCRGCSDTEILRIAHQEDRALFFSDYGKAQAR